MIDLINIAIIWAVVIGGIVGGSYLINKYLSNPNNLWDRLFGR